MILNKSSVERGFAHASIYKSEVRSCTFIMLVCTSMCVCVHVCMSGAGCGFMLCLCHCFQLVDLTKSSDGGKSSLQFGE